MGLLMSLLVQQSRTCKPILLDILMSLLVQQPRTCKPVTMSLLSQLCKRRKLAATRVAMINLP